MTSAPGLRVAGVAAALAATLLVVAGCGGDATPAAAPTPSSTTSGSSSPGSSPTGPGTPTPGGYTVTPPRGVSLTDPGSDLSVGDTATVAWRVDQHRVGTLALTVTSLRRARISAFSDWKLSPELEKATPYYVGVKVRNEGPTDLGGTRVPLYALTDANLLLESSPFETTFGPCPSEALPKSFRRGDTDRTCLVYLAPRHGDLLNVTFRPGQDFAAITWTGPVTDVEPTTRRPGKQGRR